MIQAGMRTTWIDFYRQIKRAKYLVGVELNPPTRNLCRLVSALGSDVIELPLFFCLHVGVSCLPFAPTMSRTASPRS